MFPVYLQDADAELRLDPESSTLTSCPILYWHERGAHFVVNRLAPESFRGEFFYDDRQHFGCSIERFDDLRRRGLMPLQSQADHERRGRCRGTACRRCCTAVT